MSLASEIIKDVKLIEEFINIMIRANKAIMDVYNQSDNKVEIKSNNTPVTEADLAANKILIEGLKNLFKEIPVVSEEDSNSLKIPRTNKVFWLIDPLDGTKEFINKSDEFTCNLALIENNISTLGFVSVPYKELIYFGGKELGSKVFNKEKIFSKIKYNSKRNICRVVASKSHLNEETRKFINNIKGKVELIQAGSSLKFIRIAEGLADIYPRLGPTSEWDTAAAQAILEGAGGEVLQIPNSISLKYGKKNIINPFFIAKGIAS